MRPHHLVAALAWLGAACEPAVIGPYAAVGPPPSGLSVSLESIPPYVAPLSVPAIGAAGDSVVVAASLTEVCFPRAAHAGVADGVLVVTIAAVEPATPRYCNLQLSASTYRAVVRPAPRGRYPVVLRTRLEPNGGAPEEREIVRGTVSLP